MQIQSSGFGIFVFAAPQGWSHLLASHLTICFRASAGTSAKEISGAMLQRSPYNLNAISHDTAEALIRQALTDGVNLKWPSPQR